MKLFLHRQRLRALCVLAALSCVSGLTVAQPAARAPVPVVPAVPPAAPAEELRLEALSLLADGQIAEIAQRAEEQLLPLIKDLKNLKSADIAMLKRLAALRQFGARFARVGRVAGPERETLAWLLSGRESDALFRTFVLGIGPSDAPDSALGVMSRLRQDHGQAVTQFPDLATALALVYDAASDMSGEAARAPDPIGASRLFSYYTRARRALHYDPQLVPWQLGVFVVYNQVGEDDLAWALKRFSGRQKLRDLYFDVPNVEYPTAGRSDQENRWPTRLEELAATGGNSNDRALYAVSIARALGVPGAILVESGESGRLNAWPALLELRTGKVYFDTDPDKYPELRGFGGQAIDPQTFRVITDGELGILAKLAAPTPEERLLSSALVRLAEAERTGSTGTYLISTPDGQPDHVLRLDLVLHAIDHSPGNRDAWTLIRQMGRQNQLDPQGLDRILGAIERYLAQDHPSFALDVLVDAMSFRGSREQIATLDHARRFFTGRPVLLMRLTLVRGDLLADAGRLNEALSQYGAILDVAQDAGPVALLAMQRVDRLLRERGDLPGLVNAYRQVWTRMPVSAGVGWAESTNWYQIGEAYAQLLDEVGQTTASQQVRQRLGVLTRDGVQRGRP